MKYYIKTNYSFPNSIALFSYLFTINVLVSSILSKTEYLLSLLAVKI